MRDGKVVKKEKIKVVRRHDLKIQEVKAKGIFSDLSEEEATELISVLKRLTEIIFRQYNLLLNRRSSKD